MAGCSKDKRIEKKLIKGNWTVETIDYSFAGQNTTGTIVQNISQGVESNAGTFSFNDDDNGSFSMTLDGYLMESTFKWEVDNEEIKLTSASMSFSLTNFSFSQNAVNISGEMNGDNEVDLTGTVVFQEFTGINDTSGAGISQYGLTANNIVLKK
jgi:hypothetical protein